MTAATPYKYLDPAALGRLKNLSLAARQVVEGYFAGMHRSPDRGFSVEFAEHREYAPGIDPRHIDWRVFGRKDKLYVKQYEEETNLRGYLLLDTSASMAYAAPGSPSKLEYGAFLAASLAYLMAMHHDAAGLVTFDDSIRDRVPPRQGPGNLRAIMETLEKAKPGGETRLGKTLHRIAQTIGRRALVVVISDLFDEPAEVLSALKHLRHRKHEVLVLQTLDPTELSFPFDDVTRIEDLETGRAVISDPRAFRKAYLEGIGRFLDDLRAGCRGAQIDYALADTATPFDDFLAAYLARRSSLN